MKVGMNFLLWADGANAKEHENAIRKIKGWGFDGIEFHVNGFTDKDILMYKKLCEDMALEITAASVLDSSICNPLSDNVELRQKAIDEMKRSIDKAQALGSRIVSGPMFQAIPYFSGKAATPREWDYAVDCVRKGAEYAKQYGIRIALEVINRFEMYIVNTLAEGYRFVKETGMDNVGLLADTFHSNLEEKNIIESWDSVFDKIYYIHISENDRGIPGTGHAIPAGLKELFKKHDYEGWLTIEAFNNTVTGLISRLHLWRPYATSNDDIAREGIRYIRNTLM